MVTMGDVRAGGWLAGLGGLLLASTLTKAWGGSSSVPTALAVALLVFGGFLCLAPLLPTRAARGALIAHFDGHLDPVFVNMMEEIKTMLRAVFQTKNEMTFPVSGTGSAGTFVK